jgi:hypothetical protein
MRKWSPLPASVLREVSKTNPRLYDAITIKLGLGSSYVSQRVKDCLYGKADAKALQRKHHHHDVRGPSVGLWQSLETVGKQVLLRFQLTMTASCNWYCRRYRDLKWLFGLVFPAPPPALL